MRILLTVHQFLPKYSFGTERLTFDIGRELLRRGHEVFVLTADKASSALPRDTAWDYEYRGLKVRVVGVEIGSTPNPLRYEFDNPEMADQMRAYMREAKPDLVHVLHAGRLSGSIIPAAKEFGVPVVFTATDFWSVCRVIHLRKAYNGELCEGPNRFGTNCLRCYIARTSSPDEVKQRHLSRSETQFKALALASRSPLKRIRRVGQAHEVTERIQNLKNVVNSADKVIAPTKLNREMLVRNGIDERKVILSAYGMDTSDISSAPPSPVNPRKLRVGYIGSLARHKGPDILVRAFRRLPRKMMPAELKIYGDPARDAEYAEELSDLVEGDDRISFAGTFEGERIGWVFSEMDLLVVPSRWYENTPLVVYSAFAAKTPVIATDLGGLSEAIEHDKNGLLFPLEDEGELNAQLLRFFFEPNLLGRLREGMEPVKTASESVDELEEIYAGLLGPSSEAAG